MADAAISGRLLKVKNLIIFATSYPYSAGIIAIIWIGSVVLVKLDPTMPLNTVLFVNIIMSFFIAVVGFGK